MDTNTATKFEVREKDSDDITFGIWNKDMEAYQYIEWWHGNETTDLDDAKRICELLNNIR